MRDQEQFQTSWRANRASRKARCEHRTTSEPPRSGLQWLCRFLQSWRKADPGKKTRSCLLDKRPECNVGSTKSVDSRYAAPAISESCGRCRPGESPTEG